MSTNYPTSIDDGTTLPNPSGANTLNSPDHASLHANSQDAIKAVEAKIGTGASTPTNNTFLIGNGTGTSAWSSVTSAQLASRISDETGTGSAVFATTPTLVTPKVDTINESTPANGVTVDGLNIKDGALNTNNSVVTANITDAAVTTAKIATDAVTDDKLDYPRWWQEIVRTTLGSAGDTISVASLPARKYLKVIFSYSATGGTVDTTLRFNNDLGSNYSYRSEIYDGNASSTSVTQTGIAVENGTLASGDIGYVEISIINRASASKGIMIDSMYQNPTSAGFAPAASRYFGAWANTSTQINRVDMVNVGTGDFATGAELIVLGHD